MTIEEIIDYITNKIEEIENNKKSYSFLYRAGLKDAYLDILEIFNDYNKQVSEYKTHVVDGFKYPVLSAEEIEKNPNFATINPDGYEFLKKKNFFK